MFLSDESFEIYAAKFYDIHSAVDEDEFIQDLRRFQYVGKLFKRYRDQGDLQVRLILNHLITIYNCFGQEATVLLFFKLREHKSYLKTFLEYLHRMPDYIIIDNKTVIRSVDISIDEFIKQELETL